MCYREWLAIYHLCQTNERKTLKNFINLSLSKNKNIKILYINPKYTSERNLYNSGTSRSGLKIDLKSPSVHTKTRMSKMKECKNSTKIFISLIKAFGIINILLFAEISKFRTLKISITVAIQMQFKNLFFFKGFNLSTREVKHP